MRPDVDLPRPGDLLIGVLQHLLPLRQPSGDAGDGKEHREHVHGELHRLVNQAGIEIDVGIELPLDEVFVFEGDSFQLQRQIEQQVLSRDLEDFVSHLLDDLGAGIVILVDAVPESHQPHALAGLHFPDESGNVFHGADLREHANHFFIRSAMQRPVERRRGCGNC